MKKKILSLAIVLGLTMPCVLACTDNTPHIDMKADFSNTVWEVSADGDPFAKTLRDTQYSDYSEDVELLNSTLGTSFTLDNTCEDIIKYCYEKDKIYWGYDGFIAEKPDSYTAFKSALNKRLSDFTPKSNIEIGDKSENRLTYAGVNYSIKQTNDHYVTFAIMGKTDNSLGDFDFAEECWVNNKYCNKDGYLYKEPRMVFTLNEDNEQHNAIVDMGYSLYVPFLLKEPDPGDSNVVYSDLRLLGRYYWTLKAE